MIRYRAAIRIGYRWTYVTAPKRIAEQIDLAWQATEDQQIGIDDSPIGPKRRM